MKVTAIGIDPSLKNFGLVVAEIDVSENDYTFEIKEMLLAKSDTDKTSKKTVRKNSDDLRRAKILYDGMMNMIKKHNAAFAFVEVPHGSQSARAMASYGICIGVLASCPIPMIQLSAVEVKKAGTGVGTATKEEMIEAAMSAHPEANWPMLNIKGGRKPLSSNEHLADATFAIKAGMNTDEFKISAEMMKNAQKHLSALTETA